MNNICTMRSMGYECELVCFGIRVYPGRIIILHGHIHQWPQFHNYPLLVWSVYHKYLKSSPRIWNAFIYYSTHNEQYGEFTVNSHKKNIIAILHQMRYFCFLIVYFVAYYIKTKEKWGQYVKSFHAKLGTLSPNIFVRT